MNRPLEENVLMIRTYGLKATKNKLCLFYDDNHEDFLFVLVYLDDILVVKRPMATII